MFIFTLGQSLSGKTGCFLDLSLLFGRSTGGTILPIMKARFALILGLLVATLSTTQADVVIYRGTVRLRADLAGADTVFAPVARLVLILDYDTREAGTIVISKIPGKKHYLSGPPSTLSFATADLKGGKSATIIATARTNPPQPETFGHVMASLRGTNTTIKVRRLPNIGRISRPRAIAGTILSASATAGVGHFTDQIISTTFQEAETLKANDAGKTIAEVITDITADLDAKGFTSP